MCGIRLEFQENECKLLLSFRAGIELSGSIFSLSHLSNDAQVVDQVISNYYYFTSTGEKFDELTFPLQVSPIFLALGLSNFQRLSSLGEQFDER